LIAEVSAGVVAAVRRVEHHHKARRSLSEGYRAGGDGEEENDRSAKGSRCGSFDFLVPPGRDPLAQDERLRRVRAYTSRKNEGAARLGRPGPW
jgi:hypothetical protein